LVEGGNFNRRLSNSPDPADSDRAKRLDVRRCKDNWHRFILHNLASDCQAGDDLLTNEVWFVTFNYDVSLDYHLHNGLAAISLLGEERARRFLANGRITHVYGQVRDSPVGEPAKIDFDALSDAGRLQQDPIAFGGIWKDYMNAIYDCSKRLKTIAPFEKIENERHIAHAAQTIADAKYVYVLGYGFDENNGKL